MDAVELLAAAEPVEAGQKADVDGGAQRGRSTWRFPHLNDEELRAVVEGGGFGYVLAEEGQGSVTRSPKRARGRGALN